MTTKPIPFAEWLKLFDAALMDNYGISAVDAGMTDGEIELRYYPGNETDPTIAAKEHGEKYDLTPRSEW